MPKYEVRMQYKVRHRYQVEAESEMEALKKFDEQWMKIDWNDKYMDTFHWNSRMTMTTLEEKVDE